MAKAKKSYSDLLRSPRWQRLSAKVKERDQWKCQFCGDEESTLNVHHLDYVYGRKPWEYHPDLWLLTVCDACHNLCRFTGEKSDLKQHIMERHSFGTLNDSAMTVLFLTHKLEAV